jgi:D-alanine-D-alanine ligase
MRAMAAAKRNGAQRCDIALLVDVETGEPDAEGRFVPDTGSMESAVLDALQRLDHRVTVVPFSIALDDTLRRLRGLAPRLVFNLTEWLDGDRRLDAAIAGMLDAMKLPYTGTGPDGMHLARDKALAKSIVAARGVAVPRQAIVDGPRPPRIDLAYPLIVKPQFGDGSDEIAKSAVVDDAKALAERVAAVRRRARGPALVEEYVAGTDLFVGLLGNPPRVLQPLELVVGRQGAGAPSIATSRIKTDAGYRARWDVSYRLATLPAAVMRDIERASLTVFEALKLRDYARIDYRLTPDGRLVFLEANANPDLSPHTFGENCCFAGVAYPELIGGIVAAALKRAKRGRRAVG